MMEILVKSMYEVAHFGYVVKDMERSLLQFEKEGASILILPTVDPIQQVSVCLLEIEGNVKIELVAPLKEIISPIESRLKRGGGLDHICYIVQDIEQALSKEKAQGAHLLRPSSFAVAFSANVAFLYRPSGLIIELMEFV